MSTYLYQITDLHIREPGQLAYGRLDTAPYFRRAIETILIQPQAPTALVLTGDLTDFGRPEEYAHLQSLMRNLTCPIYMLAGNHDNPKIMRKAFPQLTYLGDSGPMQFSVTVGDIQLIALDTTLPYQSHGALTSDRLAWLETELEKHSHSPVVIAMHHPPFKTLIGHMDKIGLLHGSEALKELVMRHVNVERLICGHLHRNITVRFGNTVASSCSSPAHQVVMDLDTEAVSQWNLEPGGMHVHAWSKESGLISHYLPVGNFDGPYPFHIDGKLID